MTAIQPLFSRQQGFALRGLARLPLILEEVMPMTGPQRRDLPMACRDLSAMLTTDRDALSRPYWGSPRLTSAYLRYFLPWNLVRLTSLLPGLDLGDIPAEPLILDLGSGPLTLPLALWLSRPDLRSRPVTVVCTDTAPHPLDLGRRIFDALRRDLDAASPWLIRTMRAPAHGALRQVRGRPWMLTLGNVLNELEDKDRRRPGQRGGLRDRLAEFLDDAAAVLPENGRLLAIEPGTRQGGRLVASLRRLALEPGLADRDAELLDEDEEDVFSSLNATTGASADAGRARDRFEDDGEDDGDSGDFMDDAAFAPLSPCPHAGSCPMLARGVNAWCHVNAPAEHVPATLRDLSRKAGLDKDSVSLAFVLLARKPRADSQTPPVPAKTLAAPCLRARIMSDPFVLPGWPGRARYACSNRGLVLIPDSAYLPNGCLCDVEPTPKRDGKSGALIATLPNRGKPDELSAGLPQKGRPAGNVPARPFTRRPDPDGKKQRPDDKRQRPDDKRQRPDDKRQRPDDKRHNPDEKRYGSDDKSQRPEEKRHRSDEKNSPSGRRPSPSGKRPVSKKNSAPQPFWGGKNNSGGRP